MDNSLDIILEELEDLKEKYDGDNTVLLEELNELKRMVRHFHNDVEIIRIESYIQTNKFNALVFALSDRLRLEKKTIEGAIHTDPDVRTEAERMYSPIDDVDRIEWLEYLKQKKDKL